MNQTTSDLSHVEIIPATKRSVQNGGQLKERKHLRVAAYCRVSTDEDNQQNSYAMQKAFYTKMIQDKPEWIFAGIYADEAISGTSRARRVQFNCMIEDALAGKMDYIVTKSISRFARNTVDTLNCVRQLRQQNPPVGIFFEKENIDTLDAKGELILTVLSALAQEESRSISENIRWSFQKNFREGKQYINLSRMLGYDEGKDGEWIVNPEQASIVRYIFSRYQYSANASEIARELNDMGKTTVNGNPWRGSSVSDILRNEKYVGDLEMQKTITKNFLTHRSTRNKGEAPKYYVVNHHKAIIDRLTWEKVQTMLREREAGAKGSEGKRKKGPKASPFTNLRCGECGSAFFRLTYSSQIADYTDERCLASQGIDPEGYREYYSYAYPIWRCKQKYGKKGERRKESDAEKADRTEKSKANAPKERDASTGGCSSEIIHEAAIEQSFMEMLYRLKHDYVENRENSELVKKFQAVYEQTYQKRKESDYSLQRLERLNTQIQELEEQYQKTIEKQVLAIQEGADSSETEIYGKLAAEIRQRLAEKAEEKRQLETEPTVPALMKQNFEFFLNCLEELSDVNRAGLPLNIWGESAHQPESSGDELADAPDFLEFATAIYTDFFVRGVVLGDVVRFETNFGVGLVGTGVRRSLRDFVGFRRCTVEGKVEVLRRTWQVNGKKVQYRRKEVGRK
ncbi:MAG: recombinase family protein [Eubacteriales bacterium]|nr:recombinase family protein [Eubacteriales bacterium]